MATWTLDKNVMDVELEGHMSATNIFSLSRDVMDVELDGAYARGILFTLNKGIYDVKTDAGLRPLPINTFSLSKDVFDTVSSGKMIHGVAFSLSRDISIAESSGRMLVGAKLSLSSNVFDVLATAFLRCEVEPVTGVVLVMNIKHGALTEYTFDDYSFNSIFELDGKLYGVTSEKVYLIEGDDDDGTPIDATIKFPTLDISVPVRRKVRDAWLRCRTDGELVFKAEYGEDTREIFSETIADIGSSKMVERRCKLPRGEKDRTVAFSIENKYGADFEIDSLRILAEQLKRRR